MATDFSESDKAEIRRMLRSFNEAFCGNDTEKILSYFSDEARWIMHEDSMVCNNKAEIVELLERMKSPPPRKLTINHILVEGNRGVVDGEIILHDGAVLKFCDIYVLEGTLPDIKIQNLSSYTVYKKATAVL